MSNAAFVRYAHAFLISFMWWVLLSSSAFAEMYVAGMAGYTVPNDLTNIKGTGGASALSLSNLELQNSVAYGGTIGYFLPRIKWLGVETEVYNTTPHVKQQPATVSGFGMSVPIGTVPGSQVWALECFLPKPRFRDSRIAIPSRDSMRWQGFECSRPITWRFSPNTNTIARRSAFLTLSDSRRIIQPILLWVGFPITFRM
jgi:hypothetical protein